MYLKYKTKSVLSGISDSLGFRVWCRLTIIDRDQGRDWVKSGMVG